MSVQTDWGVLQRVVLPADRDLDVLPLYIDSSLEAATVALSGTAAGSAEAAAGDEIGTAQAVLATGPQQPNSVLSGRSLRVAAGSRMSFATYFNAFPASYWRRWTTVSAVTLRVRITGEATVLVYKSTADGRSQRVDFVQTVGQDTEELVFELSLLPFADGGWYWFDIVAGRQAAVLEEASWCLPAATSEAPVAAEARTTSPGTRGRGTVTIGVTTYNRPESCLNLLGQFAAAPEVLELVDEILVVDQGSDRVEDQPDFADKTKGIADRLRIIDQGNIGGSGGFARAMDETVRAGRSTYVLLLDDDIIAEPESVLRAVAFADRCRRPTIVGGHMFSLYARAVLHSLGEVVHKWRFWWGGAPGTLPDHDFARYSLRISPWMHRRFDVDYTGWWCCLIPVEVVKAIGLSLPFFIKWDDAEYGLRARAADYPTVTLPGNAVWHVPWTDKDDALDWQAYYHQRNRMVAALLHSPYERGGSMVQESLSHQLKHLLAMQYATAELRLRALEDLLAGPGHLHPQLLEKLPEIRELRAKFPDGRPSKDPGAFPPARRPKPPRRGKDPAAPHGLARTAVTAARSVVRQGLPVRPGAARQPEASIAAMDARWWMLSQFDSAVVSTMDGTGAAWYRRDSGRFFDLLRRTVTTHQRLVVEWPRLRADYREAAGRTTAPEAWRGTFDAARRG